MQEDKSVFAHEPDSTKRRGAEGKPEFGGASGRGRGVELTPGQRQMEEKAKGHRNAGVPGMGGEIEIADPHTERGIQHGYGKNQDKEQERKTAQGKAQGAQEGRFRGTQS